MPQIPNNEVSQRSRISNALLRLLKKYDVSTEDNITMFNDLTLRDNSSRLPLAIVEQLPNAIDDFFNFFDSIRRPAGQFVIEHVTDYDISFYVSILRNCSSSIAPDNFSKLPAAITKIAKILQSSGVFDDVYKNYLLKLSGNRIVEVANLLEKLIIASGGGLSLSPYVLKKIITSPVTASEVGLWCLFIPYSTLEQRYIEDIIGGLADLNIPQELMNLLITKSSDPNNSDFVKILCQICAILSRQGILDVEILKVLVNSSKEQLKLLHAQFSLSDKELWSSLISQSRLSDNLAILAINTLFVESKVFDLAIKEPSRDYSIESSMNLKQEEQAKERFNKLFLKYFPAKSRQGKQLLSKEELREQEFLIRVKLLNTIKREADTRIKDLQQNIVFFRRTRKDTKALEAELSNQQQIAKTINKENINTIARCIVIQPQSLSRQDKSLIASVRELLRSNSYPDQIAWRAYDPFSPTKLWENLLTSDKREGLEVRTYAVLDFLATADKVTNKSTVILEDTRTEMWSDFMLYIAEIRRAHNGSSTDVNDDPSCLPGTISRLSLILNKHPDFLTTASLEQLITDKVRSLIHILLGKKFESLRSADDKMRLFYSLMLINLKNRSTVEEIIKDPFSVFNFLPLYEDVAQWPEEHKKKVVSEFMQNRAQFLRELFPSLRKEVVSYIRSHNATATDPEINYFIMRTLSDIPSLGVDQSHINAMLGIDPTTQTQTQVQDDPLKDSLPEAEESFKKPANPNNLNDIQNSITRFWIPFFKRLECQALIERMGEDKKGLCVDLVTERFVDFKVRLACEVPFDKTLDKLKNYLKERSNETVLKEIEGNKKLELEMQGIDISNPAVLRNLINVGVAAEEIDSALEGVYNQYYVKKQELEQERLAHAKLRQEKLETQQSLSRRDIESLYQEELGKIIALQKEEERKIETEEIRKQIRKAHGQIVEEYEQKWGELKKLYIEESSTINQFTVACKELLQRASLKNTLPEMRSFVDSSKSLLEQQKLRLLKKCPSVERELSKYFTETSDKLDGLLKQLEKRVEATEKIFKDITTFITTTINSIRHETKVSQVEELVSTAILQLNKTFAEKNSNVKKFLEQKQRELILEQLKHQQFLKRNEVTDLYEKELNHLRQVNLEAQEAIKTTAHLQQEEISRFFDACDRKINETFKQTTIDEKKDFVLLANQMLSRLKNKLLAKYPNMLEYDKKRIEDYLLKTEAALIQIVAEQEHAQSQEQAQAQKQARFAERVGKVFIEMMQQQNFFGNLEKFKIAIEKLDTKKTKLVKKYPSIEEYLQEQLNYIQTQMNLKIQSACKAECNRVLTEYQRATSIETIEQQFQLLSDLYHTVTYYNYISDDDILRDVSRMFEDSIKNKKDIVRKFLENDTNDTNDNLNPGIIANYKRKVYRLILRLSTMSDNKTIAETKSTLKQQLQEGGSEIQQYALRMAKMIYNRQTTARNPAGSVDRHVPVVIIPKTIQDIIDIIDQENHRPPTGMGPGRG